jgi:membrane-associated phospholipid phosphatase
METSQAVGPRTTRPEHWSRRLAGVALEHRGDPRWRWSAVTATLFVASLAAFGHLVEDYLTGDPIVRWDVELARWLHEHSSGVLVSVFDVVTLAGNVLVLGALTAIVGLVLLRRGAVNDAVLLAVVALGIEVLNAALKLAFHRPRPRLAYVHLDTYSFPSGHAAGATAIFGALAFIAARRRGGTTRIVLLVGTPLLIALVGFSRLYLGAHYLSDVLAGFCIGAAWLFAWLTVALAYGDRSIEPLLPRPVRRLLAGLARSAT